MSTTLLRIQTPCLVVVVALAATAGASILPPPPPHEIAATAEVVFVGKVASVGRETMRVAVGDVLKGAVEGVVVVEPIFHYSCMPVPADQQTPAFAAGDRIVVAASLENGVWSILGGADCARPQKTDAALAHEVAFHREMLRIVALPDVVARRAAMVANMSSEDASLAYAALQFQYSEIRTADDARPHVAGIVAALSAPHRDGRWAAMYSLHGLTPHEARDRLIELTKGAERGDAERAVAALAPYDDERAVGAVLAAVDLEHSKSGAGWGLEHLGLSPRTEARARLGAALKSDNPWVRKGGLYGFLNRFRKFGATEDDVDDVLPPLRRVVTRDESHMASLVVATAKSPRLDAAAVTLVRRGDSTGPQRAAVYMAFDYAVRQLKREDVPEFLKKRQAVFIERADRGETEQTLFDVLALIHTPEARAALERAAKSCPLESARGHARRTLEAWKDE